MTVSNPLPNAAGDATAGDPHPAIAALQRTVAALEERVAQLEGPPAQWLPLKAAAHDASLTYETARVWAKRGLIEARPEGGRWLANVVSLKNRKERLEGRLSGAKPTYNARPEPFGS
jgi:hypothetical protein